ncbi:MAG: hypothetical protein COW71_12465 [Ignavibacteriales bacterium CG18_big_fil_WC_8_21_14_2_50_31_20]|nr:MAG: hypothetical protein COW71_12465 [Ignavibacteriales bacterium CG18_big_fil_WC_8_21_14_2_50_31_20]
MVLAKSLLDVPKAKKDLIIRSKDTDGSPVSNLAILDWFDLIILAKSTCVNLRIRYVYSGRTIRPL